VIDVIHAKFHEIPHKKTLFHTTAHFSGSAKSGQALLIRKNWNFFNEVKDLGESVKASFEANNVQN
jgi:hypothetical protein